MAALRKSRTAEQELMEAVSNVARRNGRTPHAAHCPSVAELCRFVAGKCEGSQERENLLAHLGSCERCIRLLKQIRQRRILIRRTAFALATAAAIIIALWVSFERPGPGQVSGVVATVDLRVISPTRGTENPNGAGAVKVRGDAAQLRIILPPGSEGRYDGQIMRREGDMPLLESSGTTLFLLCQ
jgi:hypothetical protein